MARPARAPTSDEWSEIEESITTYIKSRRERVAPFVAKHFSFQEVYQLQRRTLVSDLLRLPLNAMWVIPYLAIKKISESCEKFGWSKLVPIVEKLPSGIKTGVQVETEKLIAEELLELPIKREKGENSRNALLNEYKKRPGLRALIESGEIEKVMPTPKELRKLLDEFSAGRAMVTDASATGSTFAIGWLFFGDNSLGVSGLGQKIAESWARDRAASDFFLGKSVGSAFYSIVSPEVSAWEIFWSMALVTLGLAVVSLTVSLVSDPLRKRLGLHNHKIDSMITNLETVLLISCRRRWKENASRKDNQ